MFNGKSSLHTATLGDFQMSVPLQQSADVTAAKSASSLEPPTVSVSQMQVDNTGRPEEVETAVTVPVYSNMLTLALLGAAVGACMYWIAKKK